MNTLKKSIGIIIAAAVMIACQSPKSKLNKEIMLLENETSKGYDVEKIEKLSSLYREYIDKFPQDSMVIEYLFKSGTVNTALKKGSEALLDFTTLIDKFPQSKYTAQAYYYKAFVYEDVIYDIEAAKTAYNDFIMRFPDHQLARDAALSMQYLGKSPEEIVASFEEK
jgi:outer membrane protein assembly factor BamD (BamD/ComL family)